MQVPMPPLDTSPRPSTPSSVDADGGAHTVPPPPGLVADYIELTKPRIMLELLITLYAAMIWAADGWPGLQVSVVALVGMGLSAGGASALNHAYDRDIDRLMRRTRNRPIAAGRVSARAGAIFGVLQVAAGTSLLCVGSTSLAAVLALAGAVFYVGVYTMWLKRTTVQNTVIGGAAGAIPPLVGWAAVTGRIDWAPVFLFLIIFLWSPPHFWALAVLKREEYAKAGIPMLPVVATPRATGIQMTVYAVLLTIVTLVPLATGMLGVIYGVAAAVLGARFVMLCRRYLQTASDTAARATFLFSLVYLTGIFAAIAVDRAAAHWLPGSPLL